MHGCIPLVWCETSPIAAWHYGWIGMVRSALELGRSLISDTPMDRVIVRLQLCIKVVCFFLANDHRKRPSRVEFWLTFALACSCSASVGRSSPISGNASRAALLLTYDCMFGIFPHSVPQYCNIIINGWFRLRISTICSLCASMVTEQRKVN